MDNSIINLPHVELLDEEETRNYLKAAQKGDQNAVDKLVEHNLRLVLKVTYRFKNRNCDLKDLFQIGVIGLIKAIKGFDLKRDVKFSTYAFSKILGEIKLHLRDDGIINVSRSLKKIAKIVRQKEEELTKKNNRQPTINELVQETGFAREKIVRALEASKTPASIYQTTHQEEGNELFLIDSLQNETGADQLSDEDKLMLVDLIRRLDPRSRRIIYMRYFQDKTQKEIGEELGVSQVQISRLEKEILKKLKNNLQ